MDTSEKKKFYIRQIADRFVPYWLSFIDDDLPINCDTDVAKVSVVGAGMETHPGTASKMFEALYSVGANIHMISTSEIKISVLIDRKDADKAVSAIHEAFIG